MGMEIDAKTLFDVTYEQLLFTQKQLLEIKALYLETKRELDELKQCSEQQN